MRNRIWEYAKKINDLDWLGKATLVNYANADYLGIMRDGQKMGLGITLFHDGSLYVGNWFDNETDGNGLIYYSNGNMYIGGFNSRYSPDGTGKLYVYGEEAD